MKYLMLFLVIVQSGLLSGLSEQEMKKYKNALLNDSFASVMKLIKKYGTNVELDTEKNTPLHIAASRPVVESERNLPLPKRSDVRIIKYLVNAQADVNAKNARGQTPYDFAAYNSKFDVQDYLTGSDRLTWAILERKDKDTIEILIDADTAGVNRQDDIRGNTPLHHAASSGNQAIVDLLIARGANPYVKNKAGSMPQDFAQAFGKKEITSFFHALASHEPFQKLNDDLMTIVVLE